LLGRGADELLCGCQRHRKAFEKFGWDMLQKESSRIKIDCERENCGCDDGLVEDHGKEARFPFFGYRSSTIIHFLPFSDMVNFDLLTGQGDKLIFQLVAQQLGIGHTSTLVKQAIQFW
jgi:asparagine synthetase B (glutamine-hydrolysing)